MYNVINYLIVDFTVSALLTHVRKMHTGMERICALEVVYYLIVYVEFLSTDQ